METPAQPLTVTDHRRDSAGLTYVYPVVSRRAGGVSIGINLNPNNACNWACVYCQVPDLTRGGPPPIDLELLERELGALLDDVLTGDFMARAVPPEARHLMDIAFSGNGEPTSAPEFPAAVALVQRLLAARQLGDKLVVRLITNGSLLHRPEVQRGIETLGAMGGEVWFKVDRAMTEGMERANGTRQDPAKVLANLRRCGELAATWVQTCLFRQDGEAMGEEELAAYLALLEQARDSLRGVHLYGLARPSLQPGAERLGRLAPDELEAVAERIRSLGLAVSVSP
ncbi:MAG TPA: radical SAM protein [Azospira sp.]|nr:radical SAM protein [Azospira sp.]